MTRGNVEDNSVSMAVDIAAGPVQQNALPDEVKEELEKNIKMLNT